MNCNAILFETFHVTFVDAHKDPDVNVADTPLEEPYLPRIGIIKMGDLGQERVSQRCQCQNKLIKGQGKKFFLESSFRNILSRKHHCSGLTPDLCWLN